LDYKIAADRARKGDFIYFDPPYMPISTTSNFTSYTKDGFDENSQIELMQLCKELDSKGVSFMVSNSTAPLMLEIYRDFDIEIVTASRAINSVASKRGVVDEIIVRNF
jgi:DNA adenine methylase